MLRLRQTLLWLLFALAATSALADIVAVPPAFYEPGAQTKSAPAPKLLTPDTAPRFTIDLVAPTSAEKANLKAAAVKPGSRNAALASGKGRPLPVGFPRTLPDGERPLFLKGLHWEPVSEGGLAARIEVRSPGAAAIRLGVAMSATHPDVTLRFTGSDRPQQVFGPYPANKIAETKLYWSPVLEGESATLEIYLPPGVAPESVQLALPQLSHLVAAGATLRKAQPVDDIGRSGFCEVDMACVQNPSQALLNQAKSVAKMLFTTGGHTYLCTGTVLNDSTMTFTPYFLTASHCIDSAEAASTINTYWFFDAVACNSQAVPPYVLVAGGAMLLGRSVDYDWALVRLNSSPPGGTYFSAWRAEVVPQLATISVIHHPMGDLKKFSQGTAQPYTTFDDGSSFITAKYTQGSTEAGSSGSGLITFNTTANYYEVRGGLFAGDALCSVPNGSDYYSRLDVALPLLRQYLTPNAANPMAQAVVVEFYNAFLNHYFISANPAEINDLDTGVHPGWVRTGIRFLAYTDPALAPAGTTPVCRFYIKPQFGDSHFYSGSPAECAATQANFGDKWIYESAAVFYIQLPDPITGVCPASTHAVYRFFNPATTNHRYTPEVDIRDELIAQGGLIQEGYGNPPNQVIMCTPNA